MLRFGSVIELSPEEAPGRRGRRRSRRPTPTLRARLQAPRGQLLGEPVHFRQSLLIRLEGTDSRRMGSFDGPWVLIDPEDMRSDARVEKRDRVILQRSGRIRAFPPRGRRSRQLQADAKVFRLRLIEEASTPGPTPVDPKPTPDPTPADPDPTPDPTPVDPEPTPDPTPVDPEPTPDPTPADPEPTPDPTPVDPDPAPGPSTSPVGAPDLGPGAIVMPNTVLLRDVSLDGLSVRGFTLSSLTDGGTVSFGLYDSEGSRVFSAGPRPLTQGHVDAPGSGPTLTGSYRIAVVFDGFARIDTEGSPTAQSYGTGSVAQPPATLGPLATYRGPDLAVGLIG